MEAAPATALAAQGGSLAGDLNARHAGLDARAAARVAARCAGAARRATAGLTAIGDAGADGRRRIEVGAADAELRFDAFAHAAAVGAALRRIAIVARIVDAAATAWTGDAGNTTAEDGAAGVITAGNASTTAGRQGQRQENQ